MDIEIKVLERIKSYPGAKHIIPLLSGSKLAMWMNSVTYKDNLDEFVLNVMYIALHNADKVKLYQVVADFNKYLQKDEKSYEILKKQANLILAICCFDQ